MFQNINNSEEDNEFDVNKRRIDFKSLFTVNDIVLYAVAFMMSMISFNGEFAPFGLAILAAAFSNRIPAGIVYIVSALRNFNRIWTKPVF